MARPTRNEEIAPALGKAFLEVCKFLNERDTPLSLAEMADLMARIDKATTTPAANTTNVNGRD